MKKIYPLVLLLIMCILSSCVMNANINEDTGETSLEIFGFGTITWNKKISFDEDVKYNNTFNNMKNLGKIAYHNHCLYVNLDNGFLVFSQGKVRKPDVSYLKTKTKITESAMFVFDEKLYLYPIVNPQKAIYLYDEKSDNVTESNLKISPADHQIYVSNDYCIFPYQKWNNIHIKSADEEWDINDEVDRFNITANEVYYTTKNASLYCYSLQEKKSRFLTTLENGYIHDILVAGRICYYIGGDMALYACSLDDFKTEKILDNAECLNAINDKVYVLTNQKNSEEPGVYSVVNTYATKIADVAATQIYLFSEEYIYTYDWLTYGVCRVNLKDGSVEKVLGYKR